MRGLDVLKDRGEGDAVKEKDGAATDEGGSLGGIVAVRDGVVFAP